MPAESNLHDCGPVSSRTSSRQTCDAHIPTSGSDSAAATNDSNHRGQGTASSFNVSKKGADDSLKARLTAAPYPTLDGIESIRTSANLHALARLRPLLSITTISKSFRDWFRRAATQACRESSASSVGIATVAMTFWGEPSMI